MKIFCKILTVGFFIMGTAASSLAQDASGVGREILINSADGVVISAYWRQAIPKSGGDGNGEAVAAPTILLFHMAGSSARGEYGETAPIFNAEGYNTLAVDLRSGGSRLGASNKTAARLGDATVGYCEAYPDMEAALDWVKSRDKSGPIVALGSSYSAGLVIKLGAERQQDIAGVLAFSPASGAPMANCRPEPYLEQMTIPVTVFRPDREMAAESVIAQAAAFRELGVPYIEVADGRHGSLMLRESQTGTNMDHAWRPVFEFLEGVGAARKSEVSLPVDGWHLKGDFLLPKSTSKTPAVLLLHGASRSRGIYAAMAQNLATHGIASLSLDLRAHGDSLTQGKFQAPWDDHRHLLQGTEADIAAATAYLAEHAAVNPDRVAVVSASYSGEFMALAARQFGYVHAYISLSPGSISDESIETVDPSGVAWLFVRAEEERPFFDDIFRAIEEKSGAEIMVLPGRGHADRLLAQHPRLAAQLAMWLDSALE